METQKNILTYKEMQDLLVDYIFNRISDKDKEQFEFSLPHYEDIQKEIADVRTVFNKLEKMDIDKKISQHTRNLSIKVNQRMRKNSKTKRLGIINKYLIPTFGLAVIIILFMTHDFNIKDNFIDNNKTVSSNYFIQFNDNDLNNLDNLVISDNLQNNLELAYSDDNYFAELNFENINDKYNETVKDFFSDSEIDIINNLNNIGYNSQYDLLSQMSEFDEDDIQFLLKEIQNAKFNS